MNQNYGEKPSSYLQRLQTALSKVIKRGGMAATDSGRQLLKQFCRGCWDNSLITSLQLEQKKNNPPSFSELLLLLRTEEDRQAAKSSRMKQHLGFSKTKAQSNSLSVEDYRPDTDKIATTAVASPIDTNKLEKQLAKLQAQMASLKASLSNGSSQSSVKLNKKSNFKTKTPNEHKSPPSGESPLTKKPRVPVEGLPGAEAKYECPKLKPQTQASIHCHKVEHQTKLPRGLVGGKCTANVTVSVVHCVCLLDTGSQVTTASASFYNSHLSEYPIQPISGLDVEAASGETVPYLGYVSLILKFPKNFVETEPEVSTLALVVPDLRTNNNLPVLIGTNALDVLYDEHCHGKNPYNFSPIYGYRQILRILKEVDSTGRIGLMTLKSREQKVIPAQGKVLLDGYVKVGTTSEYAIVEQPSTSTLPGGIFVECCLVTLPKQSPHKLPVWVRNESEHDVTLPSSCVIAELHVPSQVYDPLSASVKSSDTVNCCTVTSQPGNETTKSGLTFGFGDSPLPQEWKDKITHSLNGYLDVFALHDLDFGQASKVKHHINLKTKLLLGRNPDQYTLTTMKL
ncbi:hypothetical protein DPEC_G00157730 [Dallia pectoralis]|uniref:Uncharacterized protein n=1 Tax=Dallia pectoralis TaxID=75939 RepID=A0ACC2GKL0_DALPE|nr:hypothetical protein DPEC_G00157730 [Dallia pectoralis]